MHTLLESLEKRSPAAPALLGLCGKPASYQDLLQQVHRTAVWLAFKGIGRRDRVAIVMPDGPEMASLFLGVCSVTTCDPLNPAYKVNEFDFYLSDLEPRLVIVDSSIESAVRSAALARKIEVVELHSHASDQAGSFQLGPSTQGNGRFRFSE